MTSNNLKSPQASLFENGTTIKIKSFEPTSEADTATVTYVEGVTRNLGNYESFKLSIGITMPCHKKKVVDTYRALRNKVHDLMLARLAELGLHEIPE